MNGSLNSRHNTSTFQIHIGHMHDHRMTLYYRVARPRQNSVGVHVLCMGLETIKCCVLTMTCDCLTLYCGHSLITTPTVWTKCADTLLSNIQRTKSVLINS